MSKIVWNCSLESKGGHKQIIVPFKNVVLNFHPVIYESVCIVAKYHDLANYRLLYSPEILARDRVPGGVEILRNCELGNLGPTVTTRQLRETWELGNYTAWLQSGTLNIRPN